MGIFSRVSTQLGIDKHERILKKVEKRLTKVTREECYDLTGTFVIFILPRLKQFKKDAMETIAFDWDRIDEIIQGFELYLRMASDEYDESFEQMQKDSEKFLASMELFGELGSQLGW